MNFAEHLFEHTHQPLCVVQFDGHIAAVNPAFAKLVGRARDELTAISLGSLLQFEDANNFEIIQQRFSRGLRVEMDCNLHVGNGVRSTHFTGTPIPNEGLVHFVVYDRTDYRHGQVHALIDEAIRDEGNERGGNKWLQSLVQRLADVFGVQFAMVATYLEQQSGMAEACPFWLGNAFLEQPFRYQLEGTPCGVVARNEVFIARAGVREAFPEDIDLVNMNIDSYLGVPMIDSRGRIFGHVAIMDVKPLEEVTLKELGVRIFASRIGAELERSRMAKSVEDSEARYRLLVDHAADALFVFDRQGGVVDANPKALTELQASLDEIAGKSILQLWDDESAATFVHDLVTLPIGGTLVSDVVVKRKDGTTYTAEFRSVILDQAGKEVVFAIARDMTEKERTAQAREDALKSMSTPILEIWQGVLALPLVGVVDPSRANRVMASLLEAIVRTQADVTILDLTGVSEVDASTATHLLDIMRAASLLGTRCLVSGISPKVASTMVTLDLPTNQFRTFGDLAAALKEAIRLRRTS